MDIAQIAQVTFTSPDRDRDVLHTCNLDGFDALHPRYAGGRPPAFTLGQRRQVKQFALSRPSTMTGRSRPGRWRSCPSSWSPRVVDNHLPRGRRRLLWEEGVSFQRIKTWKQSSAPDFEAKNNRILNRYA